MKYIKRIFLFAIPALMLGACTKDLNINPLTGAVASTVYNTPTSYIEGLAKVYAGFAVTGQEGPAGEPDLSAATVDEGSSDYVRSYWSMQEYPTDEAVNHWNNQPGAEEFQYHVFGWTSSNSTVLTGMYDRIYFEVAIANEFIRQSASSILASKGFSASDVTNISYGRNEARFLRALTYYHALDLYGSVPLITEADLPGSFLPKQVLRDTLFNYIESELLDLSNNNLLSAPGQSEYGRADEAAVWTLLAKLYLNAKVYTGVDRSTDCITYCNKVINSGVYSLSTANGDSSYADIFLPDSHTTSASEIIFPIRMNGATTQSYGCTNFIIHAEVGGTMPDSVFGINGGWAGITTTSAFVSLFDTTNDKRAMFWTDGQTLAIPAVSPATTVFTYGYGVTKFRNVSSTGVRPYPTLDYVSTDYPMFRYADVLLMYAESVLRGGSGGSSANALTYFNQIRQRGYGNTNGNFSTTPSLQDILNERGRELYWEATRRTDLIRFGLFTTGTYLWPWKGGDASGTSVDTHYNLYPIPQTELNSNPTLVQNPGYN